MKSVDVDRDRYQEGRCIVDVSARGFMPEIGPRSSVDSDRLVVGHGGWKGNGAKGTPNFSAFDVKDNFFFSFARIFYYKNMNASP